ncbi:BRCA1-associated ATM activator 1 isoform X2 [Betta splendens]|uniref:BRCA1-associated ATM activator 1 isoform X2 n=1 Tax=Betta splendens TaxID=158456 RepID=A0A6P7M4A8_BETSP|nr:BRCA1-associated ATM activator 1 isoform X2 [Betta splendens]
MDGECVSLLPGVCKVLADSGRSLPDDTSLEKLLDWFTGLSKTGGSLLESCPCLLEFISTVGSNTALDPGVLSFALRLAGLIAAREAGFTVLQERSVVDLVFNPQHWQDAGLWSDPCIRIGWIQGLQNMLQHPKALSFFVQSDLTQLLLQLQADTSLFVASAASQLLGHILLRFQPPPSSRREGTGETAEDHQGTSVEYAAVVVVISEYIQKSLSTEGSTQHRRSVQLLRLLALLLAQAGPPLRDTLLQAVGDALKELVAAGCSQLTLPLMDVILAAHSCGADKPDRHLSCLLSSMFSVNKPADLIQAAAAFLRRGLHDSDHSVWAVRILLLPLDIVTGRSLLGSKDLDEHRLSTAEELKIKNSCISLLCLCLTNTPHITLLPADLLPCPPGLIVTAVLALLSISSGQNSASSSPTATSCTEVSRNVIGSSKVQKCALEALAALSCCPGGKEKMNEVFTVLLQYLDSPDSDPTVLHKSYLALIKWMSLCTNLSFLTEQLRQDLLSVVRKRVCDVRWEVRDSTVEFVGKAAGVLTSPEEAPEGLPVSTAPLLKEALQDTESYVRASAIGALAQTQWHSWQQGAALTQQQTETVSRLLEILSQDTEGFARRAVVQYFISWFSAVSSHASPSSSISSYPSASLLMNSVRSVLSFGSADLDWEVKVHTLELARLLLDEAFLAEWGYRKSPDSYAGDSERTCRLHTHSRGVESDLAGVLTSLVELGVISALLSGLVDCDRPVALKACRLLIRLRDTVSWDSESQDASAAMATVTRVSCELPGWGWGQEIKKVLESKSSDWASKDCATALILSGADDGDSDQDGGDRMHAGVCEVLRSLGLDERLDILSQSSDHVHNSPLSLLQDILDASAAHTHPNTQPGQEVIVDCY